MSVSHNNKSNIVYAFIDAQNLASGVGNSFDYWLAKGKKESYVGWKLDMRKLINYLRFNHNISKAILFMGDDPKYTKMRSKFKLFGFEIVLKPHIKDKTGKVKGNCDAELVLHSCKIEYPNYDQAIIISGDGDFFCLIEDLIIEDKLKCLMIPNEFRYSSLYKAVPKSNLVFMNRFKNILSH